MCIRANHNLLGEFHLRELEVRVNGNLREVNLTHLVGLVDVEQDVIAVLEVRKNAFFSSFEIHPLRYVTAVITDAIIAGLSCTEADNRPCLGSDTTAEDVACILEVAGLIVTVTHTPTLLYEARERLTARTMQGVIVDVCVGLGILDILALAVKGANDLRPHLNTLLHEVVLRSFGRERAGTDAVHFREISHSADNTGKCEDIAACVSNHLLIVTTAQIVPED